MVLISYRCACGEPLRWSKTRYQYEPLAGSPAPLNGHIPAVLIEDGKPRKVLRSKCRAIPDGPAEKRARRSKR